MNNHMGGRAVVGCLTLFELTEHNMYRLLALAIAASTALAATTAVAAPKRVRGTVAAVSGNALTVRTALGQNVPVLLTGKTRYPKVAPSSLDHLDPGACIGTATKSIGDQLIALEVVVFPLSLKGTSEGHYAWDRLPDTTLSAGSTTPSAMTNGTVSAAAPASGTVDSAMTNGTVSSANASGGAKQITVIYKGGKQVILVPPTAPIVTYQLGERAELTAGTAVFVNGVSHDSMVTANAVAVGTDGVKAADLKTPSSRCKNTQQPRRPALQADF